MKKFTLLILLVPGFYFTHAQFAKGDRYLGGSATIYYNHEEFTPNDKRKSIGFNLAPSFMKFRSEKFALGFKVSGNYDNTRNENTGGSISGNSYGFGGGIFGLHVLPIGKGFFLSAETGINAGYAWGKTDNRPVTNVLHKGSEINFAAYVIPAFGYKLSNRLIVGLNFSNLLRIGFSNSQSEITNFSSGTTHTTSRGGINIASNFNNTSVGNLGITFGWKLK